MRRLSILALTSALALLAPTGCDTSDGTGPPGVGGGGGSCAFAPGDFVFTEVVTNGGDASNGAEWIELYNATATAQDLANLKLVYVRNDSEKVHTIFVDSGTPVVLDAGAYGVMSQGPTGFDVFYDYGDRLSDLSGVGGNLELRCDDGTVLDRFCWGEECVPEVDSPAKGESFALTAPGAPDAIVNDDPLKWSVEVEPTPGADNPDREGPNVKPAPDTCGEAIGGPADATFTFTEIYANPAGTETNAEWVEILVEASDCVDLEGVRLTDSAEEEGDGGVVFVGQTIVEPGSYVLIAGSEANIAGEALFQLLKGLSLGNSEETLGLWFEGTLLAQASYTDAEETFALQLGGDGPCLSPKPNGEGEALFFGSPGLPNPPCAACFCSDGDALVEAESPSVGELMVTEVMADVPGGETDNDASEWFEVTLLPSASGPRAMGCLGFGKKVEDTPKLVERDALQCYTAQPGDALVFARSRVASENGGLAVTATYPKLTLKGDDGQLVVFGAGGVVLDTAIWGKTDDGVAIQLDPGVTDPAGNDDPTAWCNAQQPYATDLGCLNDDEPESCEPKTAFGSPGAANLPCSGCFCQGSDGEWIEAQAPTEIRITEVFANTPGSENADWEWFEVWVGEGGGQLNCVRPWLGDSDGEWLGTGTTQCITADEDDILVFCADPEAASDTGVDDCRPYDLKALTGSGTLALALDPETDEGEPTILTTAEYDAEDGVSAQLAAPFDGACAFSFSEDDLLWCETPADNVYGTVTLPAEGEEPPEVLEFIGTPGDANPCCVGGT